MNAKLIQVDALSGYLASGKTAAGIAADVATPNVGSGNADSDSLQRVRALIGTTVDEIARVLNSLVGVQGTEGKIALAASTGVYSFVAD